MTKKILSMLLVLAMMLSLLPATALAEAGDIVIIDTEEFEEETITIVDPEAIDVVKATTETAQSSADTNKIIQQIKDIYSYAKQAAGVSSFDGYCGMYVNWQLVGLGINSSYVGADGKDEFDKYKNITVSSGGYHISAYPSSSYSLLSALNTITNNGSHDAYNILVGFEKGSGEAGAKYGHTCFVHAIIDGTVYYSESYNATVGGVYYSEGTPIICSISTFCSYYDSWCVLDGVILFSAEQSYEILNSYPCDLTLKITSNEAYVYKQPGNLSTYPASGGNAKSESPLKKGSTFHAVKIVENKVPGHYWFEIDDGPQNSDGYKYIYSEYASVTSQNWTVKATGVNKPTNLNLNQTWKCTGTVTTGGCKITRLQGFIYSGNTTSGTMKEHSNAVTPNSTSCNLSTIDASMYFNHISSEGYYTYVVKVDLEGYTMENGEPKKQTKPTTIGDYPTVVVEDTRSYYHVGPEQKKYTLTLNPNGGSVSPESIRYLEGASLGDLPTPTLTDANVATKDLQFFYDFDGWYTAKTGGTKVTSETTINSDMTVYAHWVKNIMYQKISFDTQGGSYERIAADEATSYTYHDYETCEDKTYSSYAAYLADNKYVYWGEYNYYHELPVPSRSGYVFAGWQGDFGRVTYSSGAGAGTTLKAMWTAADNLTASASREYNGHIYRLYDYNVSWTQAQSLCESMGGHLVSITDSVEQNEVVALLNGCEQGVYYIGATDEEKEGTWKWVTGESFSYNNWDKTGGNEPSGGTKENYSAIMGMNYAPNKVIGEWVDCPDTVINIEFYTISNCGFICEIDVPLEEQTASRTIISEETGNRYDRYDVGVTWQEAKSFCESKGGHLVTITSASEQLLVESLLSGCPKYVYYIGMSDEAEEGNWQWVTGEEFVYENWDPDTPEPNGGIEENYGAIMGKEVPSSKQIGEWIDTKNANDYSYYAVSYCGFICEYEPQEYTITYDANGGTGAPAPQTKTYGVDLTLSSEVPTREGYVFLGWAELGDADTADYQPGDIYTKDENAVLYAVWEIGILAEGTWGDLNWVIDCLGTLTISGTGPMNSGAYLYDSWSTYKNSINRIVVEEGITTIGIMAFMHHSKVTSVSLPDSLTKIDGVAFSFCKSLTTIQLPPHLLSINTGAFNGTSLAEITIPASVTSLGDSAFRIDSLTKVTFEGSAPEIGEGCFENAASTVYFPANDPSWTESVRQDYGGQLNWFVYTEDGRTYGAPSWTWAGEYSGATATFVCEEDSQAEVINATVTAERIEPTHEEAGKIVYTATAYFLDVDYSDTKAEEIPSPGHTYGEPVWAWSEDYSSATATFTCSCGDAQTVNATVTSERTEPTPEKEGKIVYTAKVSFQSKEYTDTREVVIPIPVQTDAKIVVSEVAGRAGDTVNVPISLEKNPGLISMKLRVSYDSSVLTLTGVTDAGKLGTQYHSTDYSLNPYILSWGDDTATEDNTYNGEIVVLHFQIKEGAEEGVYPVTVSYDAGEPDIYNSAFEAVYFNLDQGSVTVQNVLIGDVNGDGKVNGIDRTFLARHIAQWSGYSASDIVYAAADVDANGKVNGIDRTVLARYIAQWPGYGELPYKPNGVQTVVSNAVRANSGATIVGGSAAAKAGEDVDVTIALENNPGLISMLLRVGYDASALQLTGVTDAGVLGTQYHNTDLTLNPYILSWADDTATEDNIYNGVIVTLHFKVLEGAGAGNYPITLSYDEDEPDIYNSNFESVHFELQAGNVTVVPDHTHTYGEPVWTWAEDYSSATATFTCSCGDKQVVDATVTSERTEPTPEKDGKIVYTATVTFLGKSYSDVKEDTIPYVPPVQTDATIVVGTTAGSPGSAIDVPILLKDNPGIISMMLHVGYDGSVLTLSGVTDAGKLGTAYHNTDYSLNPYILSWADDTATEDNTYNGEIVVLHFQIKEGAAEGSYPITISYDEDEPDIYNSKFESVHFELQAGSVTVEQGHTHIYGEPVWTWAEDYSSAKATFTCSCGDKQVVDATITSERTEPTHTVAGKIVYTAKVVFNEKTYSDTKEVALPPIGHTYGEPVWTWAEDYSSATATFTCSCGDTQVVNATITSERTEPTPADEGKIVYTASVVFGEKTYTDQKTVILPPLPSDPLLISTFSSNKGIALTWPGVDGAEKYKLQRKTENGSWETLEYPTTSSYTDAKVKMGTTYQYRVKAYINSSSGEYGPETTVLFNPFYDVPSTGKTFEYISWAYNNAIIGGRSDELGTAFMPDDPCTRVNFVMMLWKMHGCPEVSGKLPFSDVTGKKTTKAVLWALKKGIIIEDETFNPDDNIRRVQIVMILWKLAGSPEVSGENPFTDVSGKKTTKAVLWAYQQGITKGTDKTHFAPDADCTRVQLVVFLYKYNNLFHVI